MTSFIDVIAAENDSNILAERQATIVANIRVQEQFSSFVQKTASTQGFETAIAFIDSEITEVVRGAAAEFGVEDSTERIASIVKAKLAPEPSNVRIASSNIEPRESRRPKMCPFHKEVVDISLAQGDPQAGFNAMSQHWGGARHCDGEGYAGDKCNFKPAMTTQSYWDDKAEKAEERKRLREESQLDAVNEPVIEENDDSAQITEPFDDSAQVSDLQVVDGLSGDESSLDSPVEDSMSEPMLVAASDKQSSPVMRSEHPEEPSALDEGDYSDNNEHDHNTLTPEEIQEARGWLSDLSWSDRIPQDFHVPATHPDYIPDHQIQNAVDQHYDGGLPAFIQATGLRQAPQPQGDVALNTFSNVKEADSPSPTMDKRLWTPKTVQVIETDNEDGRNPTEKQDIVDRSKPTNESKLENIGEATTERQDLPSSDNAGFSEGGVDFGDRTQTFPKGNQADPVTSNLKDDVDKNPIVDIIENNYEGFVPSSVVQAAIAQYRS